MLLGPMKQALNNDLIMESPDRITKRPLEFYPEIMTGDTPLGTKLDGKPFFVSPKTPVVIERVINGRPLLRTDSPQRGYRFSTVEELYTQEQLEAAEKLPT